MWVSVMNCLLCYPLLLLACWIAAGVHGSRILCLSVGVHRSQLLVHLAVARVLLQRGHQLTLVTSQSLGKDWLTANVTHLLLPWQLPKEQLIEPHANFLTRLQWTLERLEKSGELLDQPEWREFMEHTPATPYDLLLLGYHFNDHLLGVAAHFDCPVAIITTQQPIGFVHSLMGNPEERWYVPQPYDSRQRTGLEGYIFGLWEKLSELLARRVMQRIYSTHFPSPHYPSFEEMRCRVILALNNHHMVSEGPIGPLLPCMLDIGGIVMEQVERKELNLPRRPFIVFSLGTRFSWLTMPGKVEKAFVDAFAQLRDYDIYWTYDGVNASAIHLVNSHVYLEDWWPQAQLLAHPLARLFITHGGKGSLSEALYYGVPMLGLPLLGDQRPNLRKMQNKGWGLSLDIHNVSQAELLCSIKRLLNEKLFRESIQRSSLLYRDRPLNASDLAAYWLEYVIRHKGAPHLSGSARHLNFWQRHLLDVRLAVYGTLGMLGWLALWLNRKLNCNR
ncbi:PREDICTED: UDP-glucuronosyltransferase 1-6 [Drosophila arizonae]|uniref:UDP-glucuronosyltransferase n=1 Tax=Drosophila arizonae TaxID=7263 RepID=A0ABM1NV38_DROAR|nr:PREDICTED: UDP-glucuronosyltransferase 1-6 [Drosophila arizonae]